MPTDRSDRPVMWPYEDRRRRRVGFVRSVQCSIDAAAEAEPEPMVAVVTEPGGRHRRLLEE